jgi:hypothetical protein
VNDGGTAVGGREKDWISHESCKATCDNDLNCYAFQIGYKSCITFDQNHWQGDGKTDYSIILRDLSTKIQDWKCYTNDRNLEQCSGSKCEDYRGF